MKCPFCAVLSNFLSHFHRVQDLGSDGIQEVSGSIPRISTNVRKEYVFQSLFSYKKEDKCNIYNVYPGEFENTSLFPVGLEAAGNVICYEMNTKKYILWNHENGGTENILM